MVELDLPMPPSANHIWSRTKTGMRHSDRYRAWMDEAGWIAKAQYPQPFLGPYKLTVRIARPDKRKRDLDNFAFKALNDLLVRLGIVEDDCRAAVRRTAYSGGEA